MVVTVTDDNGEIVLCYSTDPNDQALCPGDHEAPQIITALMSAMDLVYRPKKDVDGQS